MASTIESIKLALRESDKAEAERLARSAFAAPGVSEKELAWAASMLYEAAINSGFDLLESFVHRFPDSLHLPRVFIADILARTNRFDQATEQARVYLRLARDSGVLKNLGGNPFVLEGVSRAFLLLTAAFAELGARTYSNRILDMALQLPLTDQWRASIIAEKSRLSDELRAIDSKMLDKRWEAFFASGTGADELHKLCESRGYSLLAKRIELLDSNFRFNSQFRVTSDEVYALVHVSDDQVAVLL